MTPSDNIGEEESADSISCEYDSEDDSAADETLPPTPEQLAERREYGRKKLCCSLADMALDLVYLSLMAFFFAKPLDDWLLGFASLQQPWLRLAAFFLLTGAAYLGISFGLSFYSGFVLEHRYQMSRQSFMRWLWRYFLQNFLVNSLGLVLVVGLFWVIWLSGPYWWLIAAGGSFFVSILIGQLAPVLILPLFYKIERLDDPTLTNRFSRLLEETDLSIEGIYRMRLSSETVKANAMLTGLGRTRRIILGDTLLDRFTPEEIDVVLAHEVGHHVFRHITKLILGGLVYSLLSFYLCDRIMALWLGELNYATLPVYALSILMLTITIFSLLLTPLKNAVSRRFERQCDRFALDKTGLHQEYISAFTKLAELNKADPDPPRLEVFLFHDHPPIKERLAMADPRKQKPSNPLPDAPQN